jgi:hypothetical protein
LHDIQENRSDTGKLQTDLNKLGEWAVENEMKINPDKSKAVGFTTARVKDQLTYFFWDQLILEANSFKYLGIIIRSSLSWTDHVNYTLRKACKVLHLIMRILKQGNNNSKCLAYTSLVRPLLEYGVVCSDPYRDGQACALNRLRRRVAKSANHTNELG